MDRISLVLVLALVPACSSTSSRVDKAVPSPLARQLAERAVERHGDRAIDLLDQLVGFDTFARPDTPNADHASFRAMTTRLQAVADAYGLDFADHGAVVVIGLGRGTDRLGIITHGDVQPADPSKWASSPFRLDRTSEPGRLVGRGVEDDKGPIACALIAMRTLLESGIELEKRIELIISYTEESDWAPFTAFLEATPPPALNIGFDAEYPVVIAEKGWCKVEVSLPADDATEVNGPHVASFEGGFFLSQVPADARATIRGADAALLTFLEGRCELLPAAKFEFELDGDELTIRARGKAVHSSKPWEGVNAITHLAELLSGLDAPTPAGLMARFVRDRVGTGWQAERFGDLAYADEFMGPLSLSLGTLGVVDGRLTAALNLRRPVGRNTAEVQAAVEHAIETWRQEAGVPQLSFTAFIGEPHPPVDAPHVPVLLETFRAYTGHSDASVVSIGGGTHARLVPAGVNFGPSMPGEVYTGHSEHEFMEEEQFLLNLRMLTSALVDLACRTE